MGRRQRGEYLRSAVLAACAMASFGATTSWAQCAGGTGDAGNTCGAPGTAARVPQPRPQPQQAPPPVYSQPRAGGTGDAGNTFGAPGTAARVPQPRPQIDAPRAGGPDRDFSPGRNFSSGPDRRPDYRPDYRPEYRPDFQRRPPPPVRYYAPPIYEPGGVVLAPPSTSYSRGGSYYVYVEGRPFAVPYPRVRYFRGQPVLRPYGGWYTGYGRYVTDEEAYRWLGFSAITMSILSMLDDNQQRALEDAQIQASEAPVGERVDWAERGARGSVRTVREFKDSVGNYCREFEQIVIVDGRTERAEGAACQDGQGVWRVLAPEG